MKKIILFSFFVANVAFGQSSTLIQPNGNNGILSKNATYVGTDPGVVALPASGAGTRLMWIPAKSAFRVGTVDGTQWDAANIGNWSFASGYGSTASGTFSTAMGYYTTASAFSATAMNGGTSAIGNYSTAMGSGTMASGAFSTAMGGLTTASGNSSTAMGFNTTAQAYGSLVIGQYNIVSGSSATYTGTDPAFVIGNGTSSMPSNAFTVLQNGKTAVGFDTPQSMLHVRSGSSGATPFTNSVLTVESSSTNYVSILAPANAEEGILFGNPSNNTDGGIIYNNYGTDKDMQFRINGNATRMTLSNAGALTVANLAGTGTRQVRANANGTLTATTQTQYFSIPWASFQHIAGSPATASYYPPNANYAALPNGSSTSEGLVAAINIPHGASITDVKIYYIDSDGTNDLQFYVSSKSRTLTTVNFFTGTSSGNTSGIQNIDLTGSQVVDNINNSYYILVTAKAGSTWSSSLLIASALVTYTY